MSYFVRISDATDIRRRTLESSKDLLHILKGYQQLLIVRERKKEIAEELRRSLTELNSLAQRLEKLLPAQSLKDLPEFKPKKAPPTKKEPKQKPAEKPVEQPKPVVEKPKPLTELERLEQALAGIEQRLGQL